MDSLPAEPQGQPIVALKYFVGFCHISPWISHRYTYVHSLRNPLQSPTLAHLFRLSQSTEFELPVSYRKFSLAICFTYGCVYFNAVLSICLILSFPCHHREQVCSLCLCFYCCPKNRFISIALLEFQINALIWNICFSLLSVYQALGSFTSVEQTQTCSFLWLSNISLYMYTTSSLSIHLSAVNLVASMSCLL